MERTTFTNSRRILTLQKTRRGGAEIGKR